MSDKTEVFRNRIKTKLFFLATDIEDVMRWIDLEEEAARRHGQLSGEVIDEIRALVHRMDAVKSSLLGELQR